MKKNALIALSITLASLSAICQERSGNAGRDNRPERNPSSKNVGHDGGSAKDKNVIDKIREHNKQQKEVKEQVKKDLGWDPYKLDQSKAIDFYEGMIGSRERNDRREQRSEPQRSPSPVPTVLPSSVGGSAASKKELQETDLGEFTTIGSNVNIPITVSVTRHSVSTKVPHMGTTVVRIIPGLTIRGVANVPIRVGISFLGPTGGWYVHRTYFWSDINEITIMDALNIPHSILSDFVSNNKVHYFMTIHRNDREVYQSKVGFLHLQSPFKQ